MRLNLLIISSALIWIPFPSDGITLPSPDLQRGINGGFSCAACTVLLSVASQVAQINNETTLAGLERLCSYVPRQYDSSCIVIVKTLAPLIAKELELHTSPDTICYGIGICRIDPGKRMCHLFPLPKSVNDVNHHPSFRKPPSSDAEIRDLPWICYVPGAKAICQALQDVYDKLVPAFDHDGDKFSSVETLRGSLWRGKDCNDRDDQIYPGRRPTDSDRLHDSNCNGIFGVNNETKRPWEEELCGGSGARGLIYIGDSVGAHFHAPEKWFTPAQLSPGILANMSFVIGNEGDWPHLGFVSGFRNTTMPLLIRGHTDSIYMRLRKRNLCNHRDFQNLARNGAQSNSTLDYMKSLSRTKFSDLPALVFYSLVGNDVCNNKMDTESYMTPPKVFYHNTVATLRFLEDRLPPGSHVILIGLIDGGVIYDAMAHRTHPLGQLNEDLKYKDVYQWLNCMEMGPCHGWMTSNSTLRRITSKYARKLTRVLKRVANRVKFSSFDVHFMENPFKKVISDWLDQGGEVWELIDPVDSLHPTQAAQPLIAKAVWDQLEAEMPHVLGPVNPRNPLIHELFKNQGGH